MCLLSFFSHSLRQKRKTEKYFSVVSEEGKEKKICFHHAMLLVEWDEIRLPISAREANDGGGVRVGFESLEG